ncbi:protein of unknown function [Tenacibaculum mesophilum]|uniref:DUF4272 domain-containing protein n=1 Tax=Tenacibaculum mesophilum TaxID=104268 RepID=A0ABN5T219_9FLAO|nr:DUF4272 domain-containing protein [Tenacibaculum mesophilum]AZJ31193.1 DUF4272 domain-containing protein [Tenacibaculum mesophilum]QFS29240.1 DUF4272 domain-containing protein [Tenacibaculum mesophilum]SHF50220.1 protein of unknown function [Tenacibaculum mesophilum]
MGWFNRKKTSTNNTQTTQKDSSIVRSQSITTCLNAGFHPASSLPTIRETKLRPADEIAGRLHAIKALVLWLMVPSENLPDEKIINFINQNKLSGYMTLEEKEILDASRNDIELRNSIGWKFENAWPLAWYFGYDEPEISGQMMTGEQMQEIFINYTCSLDTLISDWLPQQHTLEEEKLVEKEDLFYCLHNAVRSAQLGGNTTPDGFDPIANGGVIHERRHSLTWMLSNGTEWEDTDLST